METVKELTFEEVSNVSGGVFQNIWEFIGFAWQMEYRGFEANNFAPAVMPYK